MVAEFFFQLRELSATLIKDFTLSQQITSFSALVNVGVRIVEVVVILFKRLNAFIVTSAVSCHLQACKQVVLIDSGRKLLIALFFVFLLCQLGKSIKLWELESLNEISLIKALGKFSRLDASIFLAFVSVLS